ncbi:probable rRNA-processing protein EBP2 homolog [Galendromus occidentalis]|uniref:Probable rRNA-processing protein EBP2 homolog n=1 Tax=Galendromus occidentalis TaxID=34638 RepID=A0AAJ6QYR2_9ACAR|nr:probable rRNA-processing protein EBP2 homolog [Galendromus occidentalis]
MSSSESCDETDYDSDTALQEALASGKLQPGTYALAPHAATQVQVNDVEALEAKYKQIHLNLDWFQRLDCTNELAPLTADLKEHEESLRLDVEKKGLIEEEDNVHNDFKRELLFYRQAQATVFEALAKLKELGIPTKRPDDYFAQMAKSDAHMTKVKQKLLVKKKQVERTMKVKQIREMKKLGKTVQTEVMLQRAKEKRELMDKIKKFRKGKGTLEFLNERPELKKGLSRSQFKRIGKDDKYGFGGQKKRGKRNTRESYQDVSGKKASAKLPKAHHKKLKAKGRK